MTITTHLKSLGTQTNQYKFEGPAPHILERFESPFIGKTTGTLDISVPEFTSLCPITGQPDFATIRINYRPDKWCVESKSLKLYMFSFRNHGEFHESCVNRICNDLVALLDPHWIEVRGEFTPRGGIPFVPTASWFRDHA